MSEIALILVTYPMSSGVRQLYRSRTNRIIGGVCSGIAEYVGVDPVIIRLIWGALAIVWGAGLLFYLIAWIIIPARPKYDAVPGTPQATPQSVPPVNGWLLVGAIGVIILVYGLINMLSNMLAIHFDQISFPYVLMAIGALIIIVALLRHR